MIVYGQYTGIDANSGGASTTYYACLRAKVGYRLRRVARGERRGVSAEQRRDAGPADRRRVRRR